jgi:hypothetical protein
MLALCGRPKYPRPPANWLNTGSTLAVVKAMARELTAVATRRSQLVARLLPMPSQVIRSGRARTGCRLLRECGRRLHRLAEHS